MMEAVPMLVLTGPIGVGKITVAAEVSERLDMERLLVGSLERC